MPNLVDEAVPHPAEGVKVISVTVNENKPEIVKKKGVKGIIEGAAVIAISVAVDALDPIITDKLGHIPVLGGIVAALSLGGWRAFRSWWKHRLKKIEIEVEEG